jgi:hypothetical protein
MSCRNFQRNGRRTFKTLSGNSETLRNNSETMTRPNKRSRYGFVALLCMALSSGSIPAERRGEQEAQPPTAAKASPEMERLKKLYLGTWDYSETYEKTPFYPQGGIDTGIYTSELGPGGNSIVNRFHSSGPLGEFDGLLVITWDAKENAYKSYVFGNEFPGCIVQTGTFEGDALVFRSEFAAEGMKLKLRNVTHPVSAGKIISEEYLTAEGSPEALMVRVEAKKRP